MTKQVITVPNAPELPFSPAIRAGDYIFVSGQVAFKDSKTGAEIRGIEAQTRQCVEKIKQVLEAANSDLNDVVKVNVYLRNTEDFTKMNGVYRSYFTEDYPARCTVVTGLVNPSALIEIECVAINQEVNDS